MTILSAGPFLETLGASDMSRIILSYHFGYSAQFLPAAVHLIMTRLDTGWSSLGS